MRSTASSRQRLPSTPDEAPMHAERLQTHLTLGARGRPRRDAAWPGSEAGRYDVTPAHHRTRLRNAEALDALDPLPDPRARQRRHRNELARARLRPEAAHPALGYGQSNESDDAGGRRSPRLPSREQKKRLLPHSIPLPDRTCKAQTVCADDDRHRQGQGGVLTLRGQRDVFRLDVRRPSYAGAAGRA
jgi:hypothetical protein